MVRGSEKKSFMIRVVQNLIAKKVREWKRKNIPNKN